MVSKRDKENTDESYLGMHHKANPEYAEKIDKQINEILTGSKNVINSAPNDKNLKTPTFNTHGPNSTI